MNNIGHLTHCWMVFLIASVQLFNILFSWQVHVSYISLKLFFFFEPEISVQLHFDAFQARWFKIFVALHTAPHPHVTMFDIIISIEGLTVYLIRHYGYVNLIMRQLELSKPYKTAFPPFFAHVSSHYHSRICFPESYCNTWPAIPVLLGFLFLGPAVSIRVMPSWLSFLGEL